MVAERLLSEKMLTMAAVAAMFPGNRGGQSLDRTTPYRWATTGHRTPDGRVIKLEAARVGHRLLTTKEALSRFVAAMNEPAAQELANVG